MIVKLLEYTTVSSYGSYVKDREFYMLSGCEDPLEREVDREKINSIIDAAPKRSLLIIAWLKSGDNKKNGYCLVWSNEHKENEGLDSIYDCLCRLGYMMSDEEKALRDGTHELFKDRESGDRDQEGTEESINAN